MSALDKSIQNESRHAVYLQRYAGGLSNEIDPYLEQLKKEINNELMKADTTMVRGHKLTRIIRRLEEIQKGIYSDYRESLLEQLELFSQHEIDFELGSLDSVILSGSVELSAPAPVQVWAASTSTPLIFPDSNDNIMLGSYIKNWTPAQIKNVSGAIANGFNKGDTNQQIAKAITGKGGVLDKNTKAMNKQIVRTAVNHISTVARHATMEHNSDIVLGYEWVSTLDGSTSTECKRLDGKVFYFKDDGYKPKPPLHRNCRSVTSPVVDKRYQIDDGTATRASRMDGGGKPVKATYTYYSLLKEQPRSYVMETLGKTKGKLFLDGGLSSKEFANLTTDQKFRPLSIAELRKKDPQAFEKAGL